MADELKLWQKGKNLYIQETEKTLNRINANTFRRKQKPNF